MNNDELMDKIHDVLNEVILDLDSRLDSKFKLLQENIEELSINVHKMNGLVAKDEKLDRLNDNVKRLIEILEKLV